MGNIRLSYYNSAGVPTILEENNYYPFGMKHEGYNVLAGNPTYNYQYNGKELQKETGWNDYGARMYMPEIGRWGVQDPLAEVYHVMSPYNYVANNPMKFIDPTGMWIDIKDGDNTYRYNDGKLYEQNRQTKKWDIEASVSENSYAGKILTALSAITGGDKDSYGSKFLNMFANDKMNTLIQKGMRRGDVSPRFGTTLDGSDLFTSDNQNEQAPTSLLGEKSKLQNIPFHVALFHEIGHSWLDQTIKDSALREVWFDKEEYNLLDNVNISEIGALYIENMLRNEQELPIRTHYSRDLPKSQIIEKITRPNSAGQRIFTMPNDIQNKYNKIMNNRK